MNSKITVGIFVIILSLLSLLNLAVPTRSYSENENRYLAQAPKFSLKSLLNGNFTEEFDDYITDQFVFRDQWVGIKTLSERLLQKGASNGVYFAEDDYLIEMFDTIDREQFEQNLNYILEFTNKVKEEYNILVHTTLVPTASMILKEKLPTYAPEVDQKELLNKASDYLPNFIDVSNTLSAHDKEYIYYKTDHHWTSLGAYYSYHSYREQIGKPTTNLNDYEEEILNDQFFGTTYSKSHYYLASPDILTAMKHKELGKITVDYNLGGKITDTIYERSYLTKKDKYSVFLNANQPITHITTSNKNGEKLLLIKDSYANTWVQFALTDYEEITVVDLRYYKASLLDYIKENQINEVLVLYNLKGFSSDINLISLAMD